MTKRSPTYSIFRMKKNTVKANGKGGLKNCKISYWIILKFTKLQITMTLVVNKHFTSTRIYYSSKLEEHEGKKWKKEKESWWGGKAEKKKRNHSGISWLLTCALELSNQSLYLLPEV